MPLHPCGDASKPLGEIARDVRGPVRCQSDAANDAGEERERLLPELVPGVLRLRAAGLWGWGRGNLALGQTNAATGFLGQQQANEREDQRLRLLLAQLQAEQAGGGGLSPISMLMGGR